MPTVESDASLPLPEALERMAVRDPHAAQSLADDFGRLTLAADALAWAHEQLPALLTAIDLPSLLTQGLQIAQHLSGAPQGMMVAWNEHPERGSVSLRALVSTPEGLATDILPDPTNLSASVLADAVSSGRPVFVDRPTPNADADAVEGVAILPIGRFGALVLLDGGSHGHFARSVRLRLSALAALTARILDAYVKPAPAAGAASPVIPGIDGESAPARELRAAVQAFARGDWPVLFVGAPDTGKRSAARALHALSSRNAAPFLSLSCRDQSPVALERALFGQERSARNERTVDGLLAKVGAGTVLLEHVDALPDTIQLSLLRVLQRKTYRRVDGPDRFRFQGRIVATSAQRLDIEPGALRADLYARLSACLIRTPALDIRREDIPQIALQMLRAQPGAKALMLSESAAAILKGSDWPDNLGGLNRVVQAAAQRLVARKTSELLPEDLTDLGSVQVDGGHSAGPGPSTLDLNTDPIDSTLDLKAATDAFQRARVETSLMAHGGNVSAAARDLGVSRQWLHRLISRWANR